MEEPRASNAREALELYVEGLREIGRQPCEPGAVTRALDEVADELGAADRAVSSQAAHRTLERGEW